MMFFFQITTKTDNPDREIKAFIVNNIISHYPSNKLKIENSANRLCQILNFQFSIFNLISHPKWPP